MQFFIYRISGYFVFSFIIISGLTSCYSNKYIPEEPLDDQGNLNFYKRQLDIQYPDTFALTQRIVLKIKDKQYDFLAQLFMDRKGFFRAVVFGDMGGKFIDILFKNGEIRLLSNPTSMPEKPLVEGVVKDILHLYNYESGYNAYLFANDNSNIGVLEDYPNSIQNKFIFDSTNNLIIRSSTTKNGKVIRDVSYTSHTLFNDWQVKLPARIILNNYRWFYTLEVQLLKFSSEFDRQRVFSSE